MNMPGYDAWRLAGPDTPEPVGTEDGQPCNRYPEPDEDSPRPHRCTGIMTYDDGQTACDVCGEGEDGQ